MESTTNIKVTFLENPEVTYKNIKLFFKDQFQNDIQVKIVQGEIVYSQSNYITNSLRVYLKKGLIKIEQEEKPSYLDYYIGYKEQEMKNIKSLIDFNEKFVNVTNKNTDISENNNLEKESATEEKEEKNNNDIQSGTDSQKEETAMETAVKKVKKYSSTKKAKKTKRKKRPGRPKKRGPKKGSRSKKTS
jgi:hypothetical protein